MNPMFNWAIVAERMQALQAEAGTAARARRARRTRRSRRALPSATAGLHRGRLGNTVRGITIKAGEAL